MISVASACDFERTGPGRGRRTPLACSRHSTLAPGRGWVALLQAWFLSQHRCPDLRARRLPCCSSWPSFQPKRIPFTMPVRPNVGPEPDNVSAQSGPSLGIRCQKVQKKAPGRSTGRRKRNTLCFYLPAFGKKPSNGFIVSLARSA